MKRNTFLIFLICIYLSSFAQEKVNDNPKKLTKSLNLPFLLGSGAVDDVSDGELFAIQFGVIYKKSAFYLGPTINMDGKFSGGIFTYQIFPNGLGKTFDFFFETALMYQTGKYSTYVSQYQQQPPSYYYSVLTEVRHQKLSNFYGYGFRLSGKNVFFSTNFEVGFTWENKTITPPGNYHSYENEGSDIEFGGQISVGIGINFSQK